MCNMHYIGQTGRVLRKRMYEHKASVQKDGQPTPISLVISRIMDTTTDTCSFLC